MKPALLFLLTWLIASNLIAQSEGNPAPFLSDSLAVGADFQAPERLVYDMFEVDKPPMFPGGERELQKFIAQNITLKFLSKDYQGSGGRPVIACIIEPDGSISTKEVLRGLDLAEPLLRVIDLMPPWVPGIKNGQPVPVRYLFSTHICID